MDTVEKDDVNKQTLISRELEKNLMQKEKPVLSDDRKPLLIFGKPTNSLIINVPDEYKILLINTEL